MQVCLIVRAGRAQIRILCLSVNVALQVWSRHGRIVVCQASVFAGVPFSVLLFKVSLQHTGP